MILINLEDYKPNVGTQFLDGAFYDANENEFVFTLIVMYDINVDFTALEVQWVDDIPDYYVAIEAEIKSEFNLLTM